jgi:glutamine amidotransferase
MSITKALEHLGASIEITTKEKAIKSADAAILPGVGAFYDAMQQIEHLKDIIMELDNKPLLGICLGLQLLFTESEEGGTNHGLDVLNGRVVRFGEGVKVPHMGWNSIKIKKRTSLLEGIKDESYFYFVHSYYALPEEDISTATTNYGVEFPSIVERENIYATQFHPEKSGRDGLKLLENFVNIVN